MNYQTIFYQDVGQEWYYGIFDCYQTPCLFIESCVFPCCFYAKTYELYHGEKYYRECLLSLCPFHFIRHHAFRNNIKYRYSIRNNENPWVLVLCCKSCSLIQERREIEYNSAPPVSLMI